MHNKELLISYINKAEIYLIHNGIDPDTLDPEDIEKIQEELGTSPCEITFRKSEVTDGKKVVTEECKALVEEFFNRCSTTPDNVPPIIHTMVEDIAMKMLSNGHNISENGFTKSTELPSGVEFEL